MDDAPKYQAPQPSQEEIALAQQTAAQNQQAAQVDARSDTARLMAIYGTRLAMAGQGSSSPMINAPAAAASPMAGESYMPPTVGTF